jgi:hypothetical protein
MVVYFGPVVYDPSKLVGVDPELKALFQSAIPTPLQVNAYALRFAEKYGMTLIELNGPGHMFDPAFINYNPAQLPG